MNGNALAQRAWSEEPALPGGQNNAEHNNADLSHTSGERSERPYTLPAPTPQTILIVDDAEDVLRVVRMILERSAYEVILARSAREALAIARECQPELIIMDIMMPEMDGVEALGQLRASPLTSRIPVILLTAKTEDQDVIAGFKAGADYYITKPFTAKQIVNSVRLLLAKRSVAMRSPSSHHARGQRPCSRATGA